MILPPAPYVYHAQVVAVYDADTITVDFDLGLHIFLKNQKLRLFGIDAWEIRDTRGKPARDYLRSLILNQQVVIKTHKDKLGKYGRWLADVYYNNLHVNMELVHRGHAIQRDY